MISLENERIIKLEKYNSVTITYLYKFGKLILSDALFDRREVKNGGHRACLLVISAKS